MLCVSCARVVSGPKCPQCGAAPVALDDRSLEAAFRVRMDRELTAWVAAGRLGPGQASKLRAELKPVEAPKPAESVSPPPPTEAHAETTTRAPTPAPPPATEPPREPERPRRKRRRAELEVSSALLPGVEAPDLDTVADLDAGPSAAARFTATLARNLWWLLGGALVLGGSVMGVREAWRALDGPMRPLLVTGAIAVYHLFFLGLGALAGRRSRESGGVLTAIAWALLPVGAGAALRLVDEAPIMALAAGLGMLALGAVTLPLSMHRLSEGARAGPVRAAVLAPLAVVLGASFLDDPGPLAALLLPGGLFLARGLDGGRFAWVLAALAAVAGAALVDGLVARPATAGLLLTSAGGALTGGLAGRRGPATEVAGLSLALAGALLGLIVAFPVEGPDAALGLLAPGLAVAAFLRASGPHLRSWHVLVPLATLWLWSVQRVLWPLPPLLGAGAPIAVAAGLALLRPAMAGRSAWQLGLAGLAALLLMSPGLDDRAIAAPLGFAGALALHLGARGDRISDAAGGIVLWAALCALLGGVDENGLTAVDALAWLPLCYLPPTLLRLPGWGPDGPATAALLLAAGAGLVVGLGAPFPLDPVAWGALAAGAAVFVPVLRRPAVAAAAGIAGLVFLRALLAASPWLPPALAAAAVALALLASLRVWPRVEALGADGVTLAALVALGLAGLEGAVFLGLPSDALRPYALLGAAGLPLVALVAFTGRGFPWARGHVATLAVVLAGVVWLAVLNRAGRPLPPDAQALRYAVVGAGVWGLARAFTPRAEWVAARLGREDHGDLYPVVLDAAAALLAALTLVKALLLGAGPATPALFLAGPGLVAALLAWSWSPVAPPPRPRFAGDDPPRGFAPSRSLMLASAAAPLLALGLWLGLWGGGLAPPPEYVPADPDAALVFASLVTAVVCAALDAALRSPRLPRAPVSGALGAAFGWVAVVWLVPVFPVALQRLDPLLAPLLAASAALFALRAPGRAAWCAAAAAFAALWGAALKGPVVADWGGPALAGAGLLALLLAGRTAVLDRRLAPPQLRAAGYTLLALALPLALAAGSTVLPGRALEGVLSGASFGLARLPQGAPVLAATVGLAALALVASGRARTGGSAVRLFLAATLPALAVALASPWERLGQVAPVLALLAVLSHLARRRWPERTPGLRAAREVNLLGIHVLALVTASTDLPVAEAALPALVAQGAVFLLGLWRAVAERSGVGALHAQLAAVLGYAVFRTTWLPELAPAWDAIAALVLAFVLVGVTVAARRVGALPVAAAVRRFAALLPVVAEVLASFDPTALDPLARQSATAAGGALVYLAFAVAERSRAFGALATLASQVAFVQWSRGEPDDLIPAVAALPGSVGATLLVLSQLYSASLGRPARQGLRLVGGLLLFLPGALQIIGRLARPDEANGSFALVFGLICLAGVAAGTWLRVRAYLFLGGAFLLLDIGAHVTFAGLRDQRLGFILMTVLGLGILGAMAALTLRRDAAQRWTRAARRVLREWD